MKHAPALLLLTCLGTLLSGCGSEAVYTEESFATDSPFTLKLTEPVTVACESARRSLLGQGYLIDTVAGEQVKGRKAYRREDNQNTFIEMNVVCVADRKGSTLYANGVLSTYDLKKSGNSASVGISAVGSISLPFGQSADSLVKIAEETIEDKAFYGRFFAAVGHVLKEMEDRPDEDASAPEKTGPASATKPAPEADIPLEQGPVDVPGIVPEPGPAPSAPSAGGPVIVPEPGTPAAGGRPATSGAPAKSTAPGPVQGFSVSAPASSQPAAPATQGPSVPAQGAPLPSSSAPVTRPAAATQPVSTQPSQTETLPSPAPTEVPMPAPGSASATPDTTAAPPGTSASAAMPATTTPAPTSAPGATSSSTPEGPSVPSDTTPAPSTPPTSVPPP